jgi:hypothetical protein
MFDPDRRMGARCRRIGCRCTDPSVLTNIDQRRELALKVSVVHHEVPSPNNHDQYQQPDPNDNRDGLGCEKRV